MPTGKRGNLQHSSNSSLNHDISIQEDDQLGKKTIFFHQMLKLYSDEIEENKRNLNNKENIKNKKSFHKSYTMDFGKWIRDIRNNFVVLIFGIGSKCIVMNEFRDYILENTKYNVLIINAHNCTDHYHVDLLKQLNDIYHVLDKSLLLDDTNMSYKKFSKITNDLFKNINDNDKICNESLKSKTLIIINNIDYLTDTTTENYVGLLVSKIVQSSSYFNLMATYSSKQFFSTMMPSFLYQAHFVHYHLNTYESYWLEISATDYLEKNFNVELALDYNNNNQGQELLKNNNIEAVTFIYQSLTRNAQQIFNYIVKSAVALLSLKNDEKISIPHEQLYEYCRRNFLTTNESSLHSQLVEFIDHDLIEVINNKNGEKMYHLKFNKASIKQLNKTLCNIQQTQYKQ